MSQPRIRVSFRDVEKDHYAQRAAGNNDPKELETLIIAWKGIQTLSPDDSDSFFKIAGYHGEPFHGQGETDPNVWGGWCQHGNVLFPLWHRAYLLRLEAALRSIKGCENTTLPFWDETDDATKASGIPNTFGLRKFTLAGGTEIPNPLFSYTFQTKIVDELASSDPKDNTDYSKPAGYETKRFPLSGLVGGSDAQATLAHNSAYADDATNWTLLNTNVKAWLGDAIYVHGSTQPTYTGVREAYQRCLDAPNYTVFSNTTSASQWNEDNFNTQTREPEAAHDPNASKAIVSLESPHNSIHLSIGGFDLPGSNESTIADANGDMGENDTAAFDPIFFFHHCHVDRMVWLWQQKHGQTSQIVIEDAMKTYPGTNSSDTQPTAGETANEPLTLDTSLNPFTNPIGADTGNAITGNDLVDIVNQCGYTYGAGSLSVAPNADLATATVDTPTSKTSSVTTSPNDILTSEPSGAPHGGVLRLDKKTPASTTRSMNHGTTTNGAASNEVAGHQTSTNGAASNGTAGHGIPSTPTNPRTSPKPPTPTLLLSGINRATTRGSFLITVWAEVDGKKHLVGMEAVLSRWHVAGCANCQTHLGVKSFVSLHGFQGVKGLEDKLEVRVHTRDDHGGMKHRKKVKTQLGHLSHKNGG